MGKFDFNKKYDATQNITYKLNFPIFHIPPTQFKV